MTPIDDAARPGPRARYVIRPAGPQDAAVYTRLHLDCLAAAYGEIIDPGFAERILATEEEQAAEDLMYLSRPDVSAYLAWTVPEGQGDAEGAGAAVGEPPRAVGLVLAADGPQDWEPSVGAQPLPDPEGHGLRTLVNLYLLPEAQGQGLGGRLLEAAMPREVPGYLWLILGNDRAQRFYERRGFRLIEDGFPGGGPWKGSRTARMRRPAS